MLSNKKLIVTKNVTTPGHKLHTADYDQFVTLKTVRASTDHATEVDKQEREDLTATTTNNNDFFKLSITTASDDYMSLWISLKSVQDGILLKDFPLAEGETLRVSASPSLLKKYVVFGFFE